MTKFIDEQGRVTTYDYEFPLHLVTKKTNPDGSTVQYRYDNPFHFVSEITNERGETHSIGYYPNGLVQTENTFDGRTFSYEYDLLGQLTKKTETGTEGTELTTEFERDVMGRLVKKTLADGSSIEYRYDEYGNLTEVDDGERPLVWRYDLMGRVTEEHQDWASNYFSYDALGQVESWQLPDANVLKYQRGRGGVLKQIDLNDSVLTQHLYQNGLEKERHQGAVISSFAHDEQGRLTYQQRSLNRQVTRKRDYSYDARGNLTHISDSKDGDIHFDYDPLSRLKAVRGNIEERFVHDATGNVLSQILGRHDDITRDKLSGAQGNQLAFHGDSHYEYDEFGRLTTEKRGKGQSLVTRYEYDCQHRLIKASLPDGTVADYKYDAFGRRTHKIVTDKAGKATTTEYLWQGDNLIGETTDTNYQSYIYEPGTFKPLALLKGEGKDATPYYYHLDQIGTPTEITDVEGQSVWAVQYRAYGSVLTQSVEEIQSPLRFQGQYYDEETGLHYNRHRYYSPSTGRFTTADPIGLAGGLNNYQYAPNPTGWIDPLGLANKTCNDPGNKKKKKEKIRNNREFNSREEAEAAIFEKAGIDIDTPPDATWEVGDDVMRKGHDGYLYTKDVGSHGVYRQYETPEGSRVIVEHTGEEYDHFHLGIPKTDPSRELVNFGWGGTGDVNKFEKYANPDKHHYFSRIVLDPKLRAERGLPPLKGK